MSKLVTFGRKLLSQITSFKVLMLLLIVLALHLVIMFIFLRNGDSEQRLLQRDYVIQKIINAIYLVEATPSNNRKHAVEVMEDPNLQVNFTKKPQWQTKFKDISFWQISHALNKDLNAFAVSIQLDKNQWLNLKATLISRVINDQLYWFAAEVVIFTMIFLLVWTINRYQRPLMEFKKAAERLSSYREKNPFNMSGPVAIRETAKALNEMQQRIQELMRDRTQMLAAISHDLRTPITRLKIRSQFIADTDEQQNFVKDLDEMEQMISEVLAFARDDVSKGNKTKIDIVSLIYSICNDFRDMGNTIEFQTSVNRQSFYGCSLALKRAFSNLISNAIRYAKNIKIKIQKQHRKLIICIDDEGPGIPEAELTRVFTPFYRTETSRSRDTGGVGLGLAVTKEIIKSHHGSIVLKNLKSGGLRAQIEFKLTSSA